MSVDWIRMDTGLRRHPKYLLLRAKVGPAAMEYLHGMWSWAAQVRRDGVLAAPEEAEVGAEWNGVPGALHGALVAVGFIDPDGVTLHDWPHHNGKAIQAMLRDRASAANRMSAKRSGERSPERSGEQQGERSGEPVAVAVTFGGRRDRGCGGKGENATRTNDGNPDGPNHVPAGDRSMAAHSSPGLEALLLEADMQDIRGGGEVRKAINGALRRGISPTEIQKALAANPGVPVWTALACFDPTRHGSGDKGMSASQMDELALRLREQGR